MWEHDLIKLYKGIFHANPGGFTYTEGWSPLMKDYAEIMDEDTRLRQLAAHDQAITELKVATQKGGLDGIMGIILVLLGLGLAYFVFIRSKDD
jgi:hydroxylamine dehydrogenase